MQHIVGKKAAHDIGDSQAIDEWFGRRKSFPRSHLMGHLEVHRAVVGVSTFMLDAFLCERISEGEHHA
ncbi:MAG: hypothetical protein JKY61_00570 [Planctomycetes bacterium]|nr:hypothetical protein [Planctomycetota bacterium]